MSQALYPPSRPQSVGEVLDSAFAIFRRTMLPCLPYAFLGILGNQLPHLYDVATGHVLREFPRGNLMWWAYYAAGLLIGSLFWAALVLRQAALASGQPAVAARELRTALQRLPLLIVMLLLSGLAILVGLALLVLPGLYLMLGCLFGFPALMLERLGPVEALLYSNRLVQGRWWRTSLIFSVALTAFLALYALAPIVAGVVFVVRGTADIAVFTAVTTAATILVGGLLMPFSTALWLAIYGELRVRREGLDLKRRLEAVFAG